MKLLYIGTFMFHKENGVTWALPSCADLFFSKYLDVFDSVRVLGEETKRYLDHSALVQMEDPRIAVEILPANTHPKDFHNDRRLKQLLTEEIRQAEAILIKPNSRKGIMAIGIAEQLHKPYMIELTGDIHNALLQNPSRTRRLYAPILYRNIRRAIVNCPYGLYVSERYLQSKYPISGKMCGCADVFLEQSDPAVLEARLQKIAGKQDDDIVQMALIGFYQGNGKGVDTAIRAMSRLPEHYHLSVLGNGTEENRQKWYAYAKEWGVGADRLHFPPPLASSKEVLAWLDDMDLFVFPTRSEGFGRVVAEAMSRGVPCFATNICTMPDLLPEECLFELDDHETLARLILTKGQDKDWLSRIAQTNFENSLQFGRERLRARRNAFLQEFHDYCEKKRSEMQLLYISRYQLRTAGEKRYALPAYGNAFWKKYLDVFDTVDVLAEDVKGYLDNGTLAEITDDRISVEILPRNTLPREFINDFAIKRRLKEKIRDAEAILIKPSSRKGIMAIRLAEKYGKPYMIELTGDLKLTLRNNPNIFKRIYNPILHGQILRAIRNCPFGLYVTQTHLQKVYPIAGKQCGCTDTVLPGIFEEALQNRLEKIRSKPENEEIKVGMVASYHDTRKGIDIAIQALKDIPNERVVLHVLGLGTETDRNRWLRYADRFGVRHRLVFDPSLSGVEKVLAWNDSMDLCILPSRSEGLPRCIVESISRACPNIVSNASGMPELVDPHWTHDPTDAKKLAELICELTSDKALMERVARECFEHSKNYEHSLLCDRRNEFLREFRQYCIETNRNR